MSILDDKEKIKEVDQENLVDLTGKLPEQLKFVWQKKDVIDPPSSYQKVKNIVFSGMGCDRAVSELMKGILINECLIPIEVISDYQVPSYINSETLVILLSYSGETLEVLNFFKKTKEKKAKIFVICGGGQLHELVKKYNFPFYQFQGKGPSRANFGYLFSALLILLLKLKLTKIKEKDFISLIKLLEEFNKLIEPETTLEKNVAKYLAYQIFDHIPFIIGAEHLKAVAFRWKKEINENAKTFAFAEEMPEFFHNSIVGLDFPWRIRDDIFFLFLESELYDKKIKKSLEIFKNILKKENLYFETIPALGKDRLDQTLTTLLLGDWLSFYLAILNKVDPTPVENIEIIKRKLREK